MYVDLTYLSSRIPVNAPRGQETGDKMLPRALFDDALALYMDQLIGPGYKRSTERSIRRQLKTGFSIAAIADVETSPRVVGVSRASRYVQHGEAYLGGVAVAPEVSRAGVGSMMVGHMATILEAVGATTVQLLTDDADTQTVFYQRLGFKQLRTAPSGVVTMQANIADIPRLAEREIG